MIQRAVIAWTFLPAPLWALSTAPAVAQTPATLSENGRRRADTVLLSCGTKVSPTLAPSAVPYYVVTAVNGSTGRASGYSNRASAKAR